MSSELEAMLGQLNSIREALFKDPASMTPEMLKNLHSLGTAIKARAEATQQSLNKEIMENAAAMQAKAAKIKKPQKPVAAAPAPAVPYPWENHQGLDVTKLQSMVHALLELAKDPHPDARHGSSSPG